MSGDPSETTTVRRIAWRRWLVRGFWLLALIGAVVLPDLFFQQQDSGTVDALARLEAQLKDRYSFSHIDPSSVDRLRNSEGGVVIFDVRQPEEYAVSHLPDAIRIDPDISNLDFLARYGAIVADRQALFYCTVGRRSSRLIARLEKPLAAAGTTLHNLSGGIFRWHSVGGALVTIDGQPTDRVHPYNDQVRALMPDTERQP